jgi:type II secretory pathway pseudopilin PulG
VAIVLVIVIVVAAAACAFLARARGQVQAQLTQSEARTREAATRLAAVTAERDELAGSKEWLTAANARIQADADRQRERADELATRLDASTAATAGTRDDGLWQLLLAHLTRRWAAMVGVPPEGRTVTAGPGGAQLAEALSREVERLREEVGVDVDLVTTGDGPRLGDDPADRVPVLLAAVELLGVLAASCQQVTVELGGTLVLVGEGRLDPGDELAAVRDRVAAAGVAVGPLQVDAEDERVEVAVHPAAVSSAELT